MRIPTKTSGIRNRPMDSLTASPLSHSPSGSSNNSTSTSNNIGNSNSSTDSTSSTSFSTNLCISLLKEDLNPEEEFQMLKTLHEGTFSKIHLATLRRGGEGKVVIKEKPSEGTLVEDFNREVDFTYLLSPHPNIVTCYNVTFLWERSYCFLQEYANYGSLSKYLAKRRVRKGNFCLGEEKTKLICNQVASALDFIHQLNIVHGQVTPSNILLFHGCVAKLSDFSKARGEGSLVVKEKNEEGSYDFFVPPELADLLPQEKYNASFSLDVWAVGILTFYLLHGKVPWCSADAIGDPSYRHYSQWLKRKCLKTPEFLKPCTSRYIRLFKRLCEPKKSRRVRVKEIRKYMKDPWLPKKVGGVAKAGLSASLVAATSFSIRQRKPSNAGTESTSDTEYLDYAKRTDKVEIEEILEDLNINDIMKRQESLQKWIERSGDGEMLQLLQDNGGESGGESGDSANVGNDETGIIRD